MSRSTRLFDLLQVLRRQRRPVTASMLARELGVSQRTVYRDIAALAGLGAAIEGEAGIGYVLKPGFLLPPLMFDRDEIEALMLGLRFVAMYGDAALASSAADVGGKITAVLPDELRDAMAGAALLAGPSSDRAAAAVDLTQLRVAIRHERKLRITYRDGQRQSLERVVWPIGLGFFQQVRVLIAWCETRADFRHFRADRIEAPETLSQRYPRRRATLMKEWRAREGVREQP